MVLCYRKHNLSSTNFLPCCTPLTFLTEDTNRYPFDPTHSAVQPLPQSRVYCTPHNTCTISAYWSKCTNKYEYHLEIVNNKCKKDKFMVLVMTERKKLNNRVVFVLNI